MAEWSDNRCPRCDQETLQADYGTWRTRRVVGRFRLYCIVCSHDTWREVGMAEEKRVRLGGGEFFKWDTPGKSLVGVFRGLEDATGEYPGKNVILDTEDGRRLKFNLYSGMESAISMAREGQKIEIVYTGDQPSKKRKGKTFKAFEVYAL